MQHIEFIFCKLYHIFYLNKPPYIRRVDYPIKSKGYRKKSTFPVECE